MLFCTFAYERDRLLWRQRASQKSKVSVKDDSKHNNDPNMHQIQVSSTGSVTYRNRILSDTWHSGLCPADDQPVAIIIFCHFMTTFWPHIDRGMAVRKYLVIGHVTLIYSGRIQSVSEMSGYYLETKLYKYIVHTIFLKEYALCNSSELIVSYRRAVKEYRVKWSNHLSIKNHTSCFLRNTSRSNNKGIFRKILQLVKLIRNVAMLHNKGGTK